MSVFKKTITIRDAKRIVQGFKTSPPIFGDDDHIRAIKIVSYYDAMIDAIHNYPDDPDDLCEDCWECDGRGWVDEDDYGTEECYFCSGKGFIDIEDDINSFSADWNDLYDWDTNVFGGAVRRELFG